MCDLDDVRVVLDSFYMRAINDELLSPIFSRLKGPAMGREALYEYWCSVLMQNEFADEKFFPDHIALMSSTQHFFRWSNLFLQTIDDLYAGPQAERAKAIVIRKCEEFKTTLDFLPF